MIIIIILMKYFEAKYSEGVFLLICILFANYYFNLTYNFYEVKGVL